MSQICGEVEYQIQKVAEIAAYLWERGWVERNGGNISINLTGLAGADDLASGHGRFIAQPCPAESSGMLLFVTATGERIRDLRHRLGEVSCIIRVDEMATGYTLLWGGQNNPELRPTSEFISHLRIHLENRDKAGPLKRCIVHAHPTELIGMSHFPQFDEEPEKFCRTLWSMLPEVRLFVPRGISLQPYVLPGSEKLAQLTINGLRQADVVVWQKHGALAAGTDAVEAFALLDVSNKGASIYLHCLAAGVIPQGLDDKQLRELQETYLTK